MNKTSKIHIAGHRGLAGSANVRALQTSGHTNIITRTHAELDLIDQRAVEAFYGQERPEYVDLAFSRPREDGDRISAAETNPPIPPHQIAH